MAGRVLTTDQANAVVSGDLIVAWFARLDIEGDPIYAWTGLGDFVANGTTDAAFNGHTYMGLANLAEISKVTDTLSGSDTLTLTLPGVDLTDEALQQVVWDARRYQFRDAYLWLAFLDSNYELISDKPIRLKHGRMDKMLVKQSGNSGVVEVNIESHQAYGQESSFTRYSEQTDIDSDDNSQEFAADLANQTAYIGPRDASGGAGGGGGGGGGIGGSVNYNIN